MSNREFLKYVGMRIRKERIAQGMTGKELGVKISALKDCIYDIELGIRNPAILQYKKIADVLGLDIKDLLP
jgi:ribosome-binding protein aMBF1 (putative translation factor)